MAILKPDIQKALRNAGLVKEKGDETVTELMDAKGMSMSSVLDELSDYISQTSNEPLRLKAIEMALKLRGALKDQASPIPTVNVIINDPQGAPAVQGANPILIPREYHTNKDAN